MAGLLLMAGAIFIGFGGSLLATVLLVLRVKPRSVQWAGFVGTLVAGVFFMSLSLARSSFWNMEIYEVSLLFGMWSILLLGVIGVSVLWHRLRRRSTPKSRHPVERGPM